MLKADSGVPAQIVNPSFVPLAESAEVVEDRDESGKITGYTVVKKPLLVNGQEVYVTDANPNSPQQLVPVYDKYGREKLVPKRELNSYKDDSFYSYVEAMFSLPLPKHWPSPHYWCRRERPPWLKLVRV